MNWNNLSAFPVYTTPGAYPRLPLPYSPDFAFPVVQEPAPVVTPPQAVSPWLAIGGGAVAGLLIGSLIS